MIHPPTSKILYVEDDQDDCMMFSQSVATLPAHPQIVFASDGEQAIRYLQNADSQPLPDLIVLDLNMPRRDGRQTLEFIKSDPRLSNIPVAILSTSTSKIDREYCAAMGAKLYLEKPYIYEGYQEVALAVLPLLPHSEPLKD